MAKYILKPKYQKEVEAVQFTGNNREEIEDFVPTESITFVTERHLSGKTYARICTTDHVLFILSQGDYLLKDEGQVTVVRPELFNFLYQEE